MQKTPLYDRHLALGAKVIDFGGWAMPVQYTSVIEEHHTTRNYAGIFDICHMGEIVIKGKQSLELLQRIMSRNLKDQETGQVMLSVMTNHKGGILDDLTVYKLEENHYMVVTNAATKDKDLRWIMEAKEESGLSDVEVTDITAQTGKIDLQGPSAFSIIQPLVGADLQQLRFYHAINTSVLDIPAIVSRTGYTGENGIEIYVDSSKVASVWDELLHTGAASGLKPIGLGARDTLRLEAGMLLYGHDMCETVSPFEVIYGWLVNLEKDFIGRDALKLQHDQGIKRKLVGFEMIARGIAREGYPVFKDRQEIGKVTSGTYSPTLDKAIGFALVSESCRETGTEIDIQIRQNTAKAKVIKLPFYKRQK